MDANSGPSRDRSSHPTAHREASRKSPSGFLGRPKTLGFLLLGLLALCSAVACSGEPESPPVVPAAPPTATPTATPAPEAVNTRAAVTERDILDIVSPPCYGSKLDVCRRASSKLKELYSDSESCAGNTVRVCFLPVGDVAVAQIEGLRAYFRIQYGLETAVLPPIDATDNLGDQINPSQWKVDYAKFAKALVGSYGALVESGAKIVALTPVDMHYDDADRNSFVFGAKSAGSTAHEGKYGLVSTFRMNPETFGEPLDRQLWFERIRKLVTKYVGIQYYGLSEDYDPKSAMFRSIFGLRALDAITGHLPIAYGTGPQAGNGMDARALAPAADCTGTLLTACLTASAALKAPAVSPSGCDAPGQLLCIVPLGNVPPAQVADIVAYLTGIGVKVGVLPALDIPAGIVDASRSRVSSFSLAGLINQPYAALDGRKEISFLMLTPVDIGTAGNASFLYFAQFLDDATRAARYATVPTLRLNPASYGEPPDDALWQARIHKLVLRAAGVVYFALPFSDEAASPMVKDLKSLDAIDALRPTLAP